MTENHGVWQGSHLLFTAAALTIVVVGINQAQSVVALFLVSVFLAAIGTPPVLWLKRKRVPTAAAVAVVIAGMIGILLIVGVLVGTSMMSLSDALPFYQARLQHQALALKSVLGSIGIIVHEKALLEQAKPEVLSQWIMKSFAGISGILSSTVLILLTVSFILLEAASFPVKLRAALGDPRAHFPRFIKLVSDMERYVFIQTLISLAAGVLVGAWLAVLGVDFAIFFGLLTFLLNYVPNVGSVIAFVPLVILSFIQFGLGRAALVAAGYVVVVFVIGNVVQPRLMGQKLGLSTLVVFVSLIIWGSLLGLIGMVLCVPFTMAVKCGLESREETRWIAALLARESSGQ
jgi:AI-2 transport protein TqsA